MRRIMFVLAGASFVGLALAGCGPKLNDQEKTLGPPPSAKNPRMYVPPPGGNNPGAPPVAPSTGGR